MKKGRRLIKKWEEIEVALDSDIVENLEVYTDGSADNAVAENGVATVVTACSWGVVVLAWVQRLQPEHAPCRQRVLLGMRSHSCTKDWGKAKLEEYSAPAAETLAAAVVLDAIRQGARFLQGMVWCTDSLIALRTTQQQFKATLHRTIVSKARAAWREIKDSCATWGFHVRSHQGDIWNEAADVAARLGHMHGPVLEWAAVTQIEPKGQPLQLESLLFWGKVDAEALKEEEDKDTPPIFHDDVRPTVKAQEDTTAKERKKAGKGWKGIVPFTFVSANVCTFRPQEEHGEPGAATASTRRASIASALLESGATVVGIQEARGRTASQREDLGYHMWASAAASGKGGCELWIRADMGAITETFCVASTPRLLVMRVTLGARRLAFLVGHAPDASHGEPAIRAWWRDAAAAAARAGKQDVPVVCLLDANAVFGEGEDAEPDFKTQCFEEFLSNVEGHPPAAEGAWEPTHFDQRHSLWRRIDYVTVPVGWSNEVHTCTTYPEELLSFEQRVDHRAVAVKIWLDMGGGPAKTIKDTGSRVTLCTDGGKTAVQNAFADTPPLPAQWSSTQMERALAYYTRGVFASACPPPKASPKKPWIQEGSWDLIRAHRAAKRSYFAQRQREKGDGDKGAPCCEGQKDSVTRTVMTERLGKTQQNARAHARARTRAFFEACRRWRWT